MTGGHEGWNQRWRAPLRAALEIVRNTADEVFGRLGAALFTDPWAARDSYIDVVIGATELDLFLNEWAAGPLTEEDSRRAHDLMELQRNSMSMFTSCGWFFSDVAGIESVQVLRYAARTLDLLDALGQPSPKDEAMAILAEAKSNEPPAGTAADVLARALAR